MENKDVKLQLLTELVRKKEYADIPDYEPFLRKGRGDKFIDEIVVDFRKALVQYTNSLDELLDRIIHHLGQ